MTAKTSQQDDEPDAVADDQAEKAVELDLGEPDGFDGFDPKDASDEEEAQLAEASEKLAAALSRVTNPVRFEAGERLNEIVRRATMPAALEANRTLSKLVGEAARPQVLQASDRLGKLVSEAVMPQITDTRRWSSVLPGVDTSVVAMSVLGSAGTIQRIAQLGTKPSLAEALGRSAAERASFSVTSGLEVSDSVTSMVNKALAGSAGLGLGTRVNVLTGLEKKAGASVTDSISRVGVAAAGSFVAKVGLMAAGPSVDRLGLTARTTIGDGLANAIATSVTPEIAGIRSALGTSESVRRITQGIFAPDIGIARSFAMKELVASSGIADVIGHNRMLASWRQSMLAEATARSLVGTMSLPDSSAMLLRDIVGTNAATARVVGRYAELNKSLVFAPVASVRPTRELRSFLSAMPVSPTARGLTFALRASRGVAGLAAADLLASPGVIELEAGELLEEEVVEPWVSGPQRSREILFARLGALDVAIPELLLAAWDQVERKGPAAVSMASHAVVETLDRTLRAIAPADAVLEADAAGLLPKNSTYDKNGKPMPTRTGRIAFALLERRPGETKLVAAQTKSLSNTVTLVQGELQSGKHASDGTVGLIRTYLVSVEHVLMQLLYEPGDGWASITDEPRGVKPIGSALIHVDATARTPR